MLVNYFCFLVSQVSNAMAFGYEWVSIAPELCPSTTPPNDDPCDNMPNLRQQAEDICMQLTDENGKICFFLNS